LNFSKLADEEGLNKTGTGLGLSICKHLIEKMGGSVKVESKGIGYGTTFVIKLQAVSKIPFSASNNGSNASRLSSRL
jgi:signal transduction histidine kinase